MDKLEETAPEITPTIQPSGDPEFDKKMAETRANLAEVRAILAEIRAKTAGLESLAPELRSNTEESESAPPPDVQKEPEPEPFLPSDIVSDARKDATRSVIGHAFVFAEDFALGYLAGWLFIGIVGVWCLISWPTNGDLTEEIGLGIVYHSLWTTAILIVSGVLWFGREQPLRERAVLIFKLILQFAISLAAFVALIRIFSG
jgi:hypothetical protein